jgi:hypothetical protein
MGKVKKIKRELKRVKKQVIERLNYLNEIENKSEKERKIIKLFNDKNETVEVINNILEGKNEKETKKEIITMKCHYEGIIELSRHLKEYIKETA